MKDLEKRQRVMQRSMRLGHCICDPKKPCPCDIFRDRDVCPCAGETLEMPTGPWRLTSLVSSPGCASKIDARTLARVLGGLPTLADPRVLVGASAGDDAGVYRLSDELALVQTVDVFAPSVDDPYLFGQIAAANSVSDVYAMGGRPITALSIIGFPIGTVPDEVMRAILRGGIDKLAEAGVPVLGGHSIKDSEIKAGFAVTGLVHPERILTNAGAQPGDRLILTKPLGTGILAFAAQLGRAPEGSLEAAGRWMATLNRGAAERMLEYQPHACTDITGFGLLGHLGAMAAASGVDLEIIGDRLPLLPGVWECATNGIVPGAAERNREASAHLLVSEDAIPPAVLEVCLDPQTSGGLLIAVSESRAEPLLRRLRDEGLEEAAIVGQVTGPGSGRIRIGSDGSRRSHPPSPPTPTKTLPNSSQEEKSMECCPGGHPTPSSAEPSATVDPIQQKFQEFVQAASAPGALDARTKQAIAVALSVLAKCEPCVQHHTQKARQMGFSAAEIDEAAWMAVLFGGSPTNAFYQGTKKGRGGGA